MSKDMSNSATDNTTQERMIELELKLAHQQQAFDELNEMVTRQWKIIDRLERQLGNLTEQMAELEHAGKSAGGKEPLPPHY